MASLILIILIIYVWTYFSTFCHEMGHFIFAKLAGMSPYLVKIGVGYKPLQLQLFKATFEFRILPCGGTTHAYSSTLDGFKVKFICFAIGGIFANFMLLAFLINLLRIKSGVIIWILIIIELILLLFDLIPYEVRVSYKENIQNDGKLIVSALAINYKKLFEELLKEYNKQMCRYKNDKETLPKTFLNNDVRTLKKFIEAQLILYQYNAFDEAVELFLEILNSPNISNLEKAFILDNLACIVVMNGYKKYLVDADKWSQEALSLASYSKTLKGTRGAILIELGRYDEGKQLLLPLTEAGNEPIDIALSSCYIAKAEYFIGNLENVNPWLAKAKKIGGADVNKVLKRIQQEINYSL
ncbi:MAG TPA: hypothetical protein DCL61_31125 [Cyanobacteria bacterium UBA12227]|nr:hypothetical protein [Cyanobacteria bacterium UBA12227]HBY79818.1 hypothetical protein [Cyanobacteria bacterium UBA11148]